MSQYWSRRTRSLDPYIPGEQPRDRRYIKLNTNENPYPPSPGTLQAIQGAAQGDLRLYPDPSCLELRTALAARYGCALEEVFVGNGSDEILGLVFGAFFESAEGPANAGSAAASGPALAGPPEAAPGTPGAGSQLSAEAPLLFPDITYSFYPVYAKLWDIPYEEVPLADDLSIRPEDYLRPSRGVIFPNPNAPTSRALGRKEILDVVRYQREQGRVVVVDEAYVDFGAESLARDIRDNPNLLVVHTYSKSRSLAGLRVGFALGQADLVEGIRRIKDSFNSYTLDRAALAGAVAALKDQAYYDEMNANVVATRERVAAQFAGLGFDVPPSTANFIFPAHPTVPATTLFAKLRERGVLVRHFKHPRIVNRLRISIGTDEEIDQLLAAVRAILQEES